MTAIAEAGITLRHEKPGKQRMPCSQCEKGKGDDALEVTVTPRRWAFWKCWRCAWEGGAPLDDWTPPSRPKARPDLHLTPPTAKPVASGLSAKAKALLSSCRPITADSAASLYFHGRGCTLPENDVLWHPNLWHPPTGHVGPAIVAIVTDAVTGVRISLHMTWIRPDGSGKADLPKPRLMFKGHRKHGGVVRLVADEEVTTGLCIAEGLETALTAAHGFTPVWALIDAGNLADFPVLDGIESLTVALDHDKAGIAAFNAVAARWLAAGREVRQWQPPEHGMDINDWLGAAA